MILAISGNIGTGKTTLSNALATQLKCDLLDEDVNSNAFLPRFYNNMQRWAFHSQSAFLISRAEQIIARVSARIIIDRTIEEDIFVFARALARQQILDSEEYKLLIRIFEVISKDMPVPDMTIYLYSETESIIERVSERGNAYEAKISKEYISMLDVVYREWRSSLKGRPIVDISTDEYDFRLPGDVGRIVELIKSFAD